MYPTAITHLQQHIRAPREGGGPACRTARSTRPCTSARRASAAPPRSSHALHPDTVSPRDPETQRPRRE
eukprot:2527146-Rhodomonas_salina.1